MSCINAKLSYVKAAHFFRGWSFIICHGGPPIFSRLGRFSIILLPSPPPPLHPNFFLNGPLNWTIFCDSHILLLPFLKITPKNNQDIKMATSPPFPCSLQVENDQPISHFKCLSVGTSANGIQACCCFEVCYPISDCKPVEGNFLHLRFKYLKMHRCLEQANESFSS